MDRRAFLACGSGAALVAAAGLRAETIGSSGWVFGIIADVQYADVVPEGRGREPSREIPLGNGGR
jgi:hypothetical protein